jgi:hypothetical protein
VARRGPRWLGWGGSRRSPGWLGGVGWLGAALAADHPDRGSGGTKASGRWASLRARSALRGRAGRAGRRWVRAGASRAALPRCGSRTGPITRLGSVSEPLVGAGAARRGRAGRCGAGGSSWTSDVPYRNGGERANGRWRGREGTVQVLAGACWRPSPHIVNHATGLRASISIHASAVRGSINCWWNRVKKHCVSWLKKVLTS